MNIRTYFAYVILCFASMISFSSMSAEHGHQLIDMKDKYVAKILREKLVNNNIWFKNIDGVSLHIKQESTEEVLEILNKIGSMLLPEGRHASFVEPALSMLLKELNNSKINYSVVNLYDSQWVIWGDEDSQTVGEIIRELMHSLHQQNK